MNRVVASFAAEFERQRKCLDESFTSQNKNDKSWIVDSSRQAGNEMGEIIRTWMRTRLGVIIDLSPEIFGHYARDGTLLAKLLHSYDIINDSQLRTLNRTQDPALARVNLKNLRIWLRFIGVNCDDECIEDISNGKGTTALRLFYKVFLCLENKDTLHFVTLQKEREKYIPSSSKFDVTTVSEEPEPWAPEDHPFAVPLKKSANLVDWHRKKYRELIEGCKKERAKFRSSQERNEIRKATVAEEKTPPRRSTKSIVEEAEKKELDEFAKKHRIKRTDELPDSCEDIRVSSPGKDKAQRVDKEAAKAYTKSLKSKHRQEEATRNFKSRMQKNLLAELWEQVLSDQEMELDEIVARKVLHQSQYEKQLMRKLCDIRSEKTRMAGNRRIVEELSQSTRESEERLDQERANEVLVRESEEVEAESRRMKELERKINEEAARKKLMKLRRIGAEVLDDLVDITVKSAEYKIDSNDDSVPNSLWNEWKALFVKSQPIVEASEFVKHPDIHSKKNEVEFGEGEEDIDDEMEEEIDPARNEVLNDEDFENYNKMRSPWKDFVPNIDVEVREFLNLGLSVLGYIVHKILDSLYRRNQEPMEPPLPKMKTRAVVLDIPDSLLYEPIQKLLRRSRIHLVRMEEAINHCLEQYKREMQDIEFIDLNIIAATKESATRQASSTALEPEKKDRKKEDKSVSSRVKTGSSIQRIDRSKSGIDKLTQTPRVIPYEDMDPTLTDTAYIGKWTHEFLTLGTPLSDELNARIIVEYLKSLRDVDGFVLVNYPNTYQQMTSLEYALSGRRLPDDGNKYSTGREEINIEDIDPVPSRISFESGGGDAVDNWRRSRLVPNPIERREASDGNSYLTAFVRIKPKSDDSELDDNQRYEVLSGDSTSLEAFYAEQSIALILYYKIFDLATLKRLVRLVVTGDESMTRISSSELFGEAAENFAGRRRSDYPSGSRAPIVKKLMSRASDYSLAESGSSEWTERSHEIDQEFSATPGRSKDEPPRPGEADWSWAHFSQPAQLLEGLAALWRNLESSYIDNLKDMFFLKRTSFGAIVPYANFVAKHMKEFIERPDRKQDLLHEFHRVFNDMDEEIREDVEVKHELHCRVADLQTQLWEICNLRRQEADDERKRITLDHWTTQESMILGNVYIGIIQAEIDRYTDTMQLIQDYYLSMLQRPLQERRSRVFLQKIPFEMSTSGSREEIVSTVKLSSKSVRDKDSKEAKSKISSAKMIAPPSLADENLFKEEMFKLLTDFDREVDVPVETIAYKTVAANIRYVQNLVESIASPVLESLKKEETTSAKSSVELKDKKGSSRKVSESSRVEQETLRKRTQDLILEWRYAVMYEINRIRLKLKTLEGAARADINFLVDKMKRVFFEIHERIVDRFKREAKSVDEMASTFCFAIEEATPIQKEMLLDGDRFVVRSNVLMFPDKPEPRPRPTREEFLPSRFQIAQLGRLMDIFRRVAPTGTLPERAFVYILQDLIVCGDEEHETCPLPSSWLELRACDVSKIIDELFGDVQFVDWREFIIYAMDIEPPSVDQILNALEAFRKLDKQSTEVISCEEFHSVGLWFFDRTTNEAASLRFALHENFETEEEEILGRYNDTAPTKQSSTGHSDEKDDTKPEDALRFTLAKELLCEMFLSEPRTINYIALLLAFCKDEDPRHGLAKALSLATSNKICADWEEGEKYVTERLEKRRRATEARAYRSSLREEATKTAESVVRVILNGVLSNSKLNSMESLEGISSPNEDPRYSERAPIRIEKLDVPGESVNPEDLLPPKNTPISPLSDEAEKVQIIEETLTVQPSVMIVLPEEFDKPTRDGELRKLVYWISLDVCQSVLAAMLPRHAAQPDLFESGKNLRSNLEQIYDDLRIEELHGEAGVVLAHRFLGHGFVKKLIADSSIFTAKSLSKVLDKVLHSNK